MKNIKYYIMLAVLGISNYLLITTELSKYILGGIIVIVIVSAWLEPSVAKVKLIFLYSLFLLLQLFLGGTSLVYWIQLLILCGVFATERDIITKFDLKMLSIKVVIRGIVLLTYN